MDKKTSSADDFAVWRSKYNALVDEVTSKVSDSLDDASTNKALSANKGKELSDRLNSSLVPATEMSVGLVKTSDTVTVDSDGTMHALIGSNGAGISWDSINGKPVTYPPSEHTQGWDTVTEKPATYPPDVHTHEFSSIQNKPSEFVPAPHTQGWDTITGKPEKFVPADHTQGWDTIENKPEKFIPTVHTHSYPTLEDIPSDFPPSAHTHTFDSVTDKPATYTPSVHTHSYPTLDDIPEEFKPAYHEHEYTQIQNKPLKFPPDTHTHVFSTLENIPSAFPPAEHTHTFTAILDKPATYPPSVHTHSYLTLEDIPEKFKPDMNDATLSSALIDAGKKAEWSGITDKPTIINPPSGLTAHWPMLTQPEDGWLICNGKEYSADGYTDLNNVIRKLFAVKKSGWIRNSPGSQLWNCMDVDRTSLDVFVCSGGVSGGVYVQRGGRGDWIDTKAVAGNWTSCSVDQNTGDLWACMTSGGIWVLRKSTGVWEQSDPTVSDWSDILFDSKKSEVWCASIDTLKVLRSGAWKIISSGESWSSMALNSQSDLYICCGLEIRKISSGSESWEVFATDYDNWTDITINKDDKIWAHISTEVRIFDSVWRTTPGKFPLYCSLSSDPVTGDVWVAGYDGEIKVMRNGLYVWESTYSGRTFWTNLTILPTSTVYACADNGDAGLWILEKGKIYTQLSLPYIPRQHISESPMWNIAGEFLNCFDIVVDEKTGDLYMSEYGGEVRVFRYKTEEWESTNSGTQLWSCLGINKETSEIYACVYGGDVRVYRNGVWESLGGLGYWTGISIDSKRNEVWVCATNSTIKVYRSGAWVDTGGESTSWSGIAVDERTGDVWACIYSSMTNSNDIRVLRGGTGSWARTGSGNFRWTGIVVDQTSSDVWACSENGEVKVIRGGTGTWILIGSGVHFWTDIDFNQDTLEPWVCAKDGIRVYRNGEWINTAYDMEFWSKVAVNSKNKDVWSHNGEQVKIFCRPYVNFVMKI